ncbi:hypothetical protein OG895_22345 [Streptomyces sp. NBC_00201]|uniref:SH3 domain-containing protein n=1 Tax=unclassified Streptomyces TaxID=2593676 RepID=UPI0022590E16|nr:MULTISPECIES: hypothetical protein [unclassified Streptomyces]MCX5247917.1 hypothetical protein [Streptomyces sp. NBC_00201]
MSSTVRNGFAFAAITLALTGGLAVAGPAHAEVHGTQPVAARISTLVPVSDNTSAASVRKVRIKGTQVALRECPRTSCRVVTRVSNTTLRAFCQTNRHTTKVSGNKWWTKVTLLHGSDPAWVSNHYVRGAAPKVPHLPGC